MNIHDYMSPEMVALDISADDKRDLLIKLVTLVAERGLLNNIDEVVNSLIERERLMTTGIKRGFAIPHAFTSQLGHSIVSFARIPDGIQYQSLDGEPVYVVFLLLGPPDAQGIHLKLLARLARLLSLGQLFKQLMAAQEQDEIIQIISQEESKFQPVKKFS